VRRGGSDRLYLPRTRHAGCRKPATDAERKAEPASGAAVLSGAPAIGEVRSTVYRPTPSSPAPLQPEPPAAGQPSDRAETSLAQGDDDATKATPARPAPKGPVDDRTIGNDGRYLGRQPWPAVPFCICQWHHSADTGQRRPRARASRCSKSRAGLRRSGRRSRSLWDRRCWLSDLSAGQIDTAGQCEKQAFLAQPGATAASDYLQASLHDPISPYQVKAGTVIPAVMVGGINSDVPGMIVGQVADNVYDTATGRYLLISQGAKLIGAYNNWRLRQ